MAPKESQVASEVEQDHREINQHIGELKLWCERDVKPKHFPSWKLQFIWQLRDFKNRLLKHFDLEEEGGFMQEVLREAPQTQRTIRKLKREHAQIIVDIDDITGKLKSMQEKEISGLVDIKSGLKSLFSDLRNHENEEHRLMQKAYYREFGGAD